MGRMHHPAHPGEVLKAFLPPELTVTEAAQRLGVSRVQLSRLLNSRAAMSADMALRVSLLTGTSAESWLNNQARLTASALNSTVYSCFGIFFIFPLPKLTSILRHPWKTIFRGKLSIQSAVFEIRLYRRARASHQIKWDHTRLNAVAEMPPFTVSHWNMTCMLM
ncbi:MAG: addiction module antidote protein, HigA family [Hydrogenophilales bacterium 17-64-34]|nr:MAG: addiction module antidote protein, HigA family [Hydrogenophilales bacterium 17-64-34]